jgi:DNA-binding NarL/FixJ family response regulator
MEHTALKNERHFHSALIVDDHPLFCDALSMTLGAVADIRKIQTAANLSDALALISNGFAPDLVVLDLNLPDVNTNTPRCPTLSVVHQNATYADGLSTGLVFADDAEIKKCLSVKNGPACVVGRRNSGEVVRFT